MLTIVPADYLARLLTASLAQTASRAAATPWPSGLEIPVTALAFLIFALVALVVRRAVWGGSAELRDAAYRVLDRILHALTGR